MKALFLVAPGQTELRDVPKPEPADDEALLRVEKVGFCGGDLNGYRGTFALQEYPHILGHEVGAVVEAVGAAVPAKIKSGMKVTLWPYKNCGTCMSCRRGRPNACCDNRTMGVRRPGAMTNYIAVDWRELYPSSVLATTELALVEPLTVGFHAVDRGQVEASDTVAVLGCGMVGLGAVSAAAGRQAKVIAVDIDDKKVAIAQQAGACCVVNNAEQDLHEELAELTDGDGPDVIIEAVGNPRTFRAAVDEVAFTGRVVYIGYAKKPVEYETKTIVQKELTILGSRNCLNDFPAVIRMLEGGTFPVEAVVSRTVPLEEAGAALAAWSERPGDFTKILVDLTNGQT
ncbi:MAG: zinc-binding alcohol dehydrogenase family protein [Sedimentisphaerales bacterium]|nr:zinc-binding alcohol dehydrogenase family protein [Sedimentisphaerales bacterium]